ncbi:recombinase family protein [Pseudomonas parafulva]|uniref:recombinase family protein n=1 Tax=Pseudomonas parafulva TaxID=157782 RepID=UPI0004029B79|nr:recombinase family protein [Pseudomonas parafulva]
MAKQPRLAFSYVRFSSLKQRHGDSLKRQQGMVARWLLTHPEYKLSEASYQDLGKSGYSGEHLDNAFGRLLAAVENGTIPKGSAVLIEQIDRAGRMEPMEMLPLLSRIVNSGVDLVTLDDGIVYDRASLNSNHLFLLVAKVQQAHQYSDSLSRRLKAAYQTKRDRAAAGEGATRRMPLWIRDGKLRDDIAPFVAQVFEDFAAGIGERRILGRLKGQHPDFETISPSTFRRWLRNPVAVGRWNDIEDVWPAVISKELWFRVQKRLNDNHTPRLAASKYLLSGLVKCARCGKNYCVGGQKGALVMLCVSRHRFGAGVGGCTNKRSIPYAVFDFIRSQTAHAALIRASQSQNLTANERRQIEIDGELAELRKQSEHAAEGLVRYGMVKSITDVLDRVTAQIDQLEAERVLLQTTPVKLTIDDMVSIEDDMINEGDTVKLNALLQGVGYTMLVDDRKITVNETSVYSDSTTQVYEYLGPNRVIGTYKLAINDERVADLPNLDSKVQKAEIAAQLEQEAKYESGELLRQSLQWNGEEFIDVATGLAIGVGHVALDLAKPDLTKE